MLIIMEIINGQGNQKNSDNNKNKIDLNNNNHRFSFPLHSDRKYSVWAEINDMLYELCIIYPIIKR